MRPIWLALWTLLPWSCCSKKQKRGDGPLGNVNIPGLGGGIPGGGLGGGPPWRKAIDKVFNEACELNKGRPSVFCFPDKKALLEALEVEQFGLSLTDESFLMDLHVVIEQLWAWPPAWRDIVDVLTPKKAWTKAYCEKIVGSEWWNAVPLMRKSFLSPQQTLVQLEKDSPYMLIGMKRWLDDLKYADEKTRALLKVFKEADAADAKSKSVHARPLMNLMQHIHARSMQHIVGKACKGSKAAMEKFKKGHAHDMTLLHHAASLGDVAGAKAFLKALPKGERAAFALKQDRWGYTATDWARRLDLPELVEVLGNAVGSAPAHPVTLFPAVDEESGQCPAGGCEPAGAGGWNEGAEKAWTVPAEWLPPADAPCAFDTIAAAQFDFATFMHHYVLHMRPLLIKGGAKFKDEVLRGYSRAGLLEAAGDVKVALERFPKAKEYDGSKPQSKLLREYVSSLDERAQPEKRLHYLFHALAKEELERVDFNFTASLPEMLSGKVEQGGTHFSLGGVFMGTPPHHHGPAMNSLVHGRKLWILEPPGREVIRYEAAYDYLLRTGGAPDARRCLQEAGDAFFVPRAWTNSDVCLTEHCVGASHQFSHKEWDLRD